MTQLAAPIAELGIELLAELRDFSALQLESLLVRDASYHLKELYEKFLDGSLDPNVFGSEASL